MLTELINNIYSRLEDEESKYIFNLRLQLNLDKNPMMIVFSYVKIKQLLFGAQELTGK